MQTTIKKMAFTTVLGLSLASAPAMAELYVGGGIGNGSIDASERYADASFDFDQTDFGYKLYGGYRYSEYLGFELAYVDLGSPQERLAIDTGDGVVRMNIDAEVSGYAGKAVLSYPFAPFEAFASAGLFNYDSDIQLRLPATSERLSASDSGTDIAYGFGGKYVLDRVALRAEFEIFEVDDADVDLWTIGAEYRF